MQDLTQRARIGQTAAGSVVRGQRGRVRRDAHRRLHARNKGSEQQRWRADGHRVQCAGVHPPGHPGDHSRLALASGRRGRVGPTLLALSGAALAGAGIAQADMAARSSPLTLTHGACAMLSGLAWAVGLFWIAPMLRADLRTMHGGGTSRLGSSCSCSRISAGRSPIRQPMRCFPAGDSRWLRGLFPVGRDHRNRAVAGQPRRTRFESSVGTPLRSARPARPGPPTRTPRDRAPRRATPGCGAAGGGDRGAASVARSRSAVLERAACCAGRCSVTRRTAEGGADEADEVALGSR